MSVTNSKLSFYPLGERKQLKDQIVRLDSRVDGETSASATTDATLAVTTDDANKVIRLSRAAGITATLPASSGSGNVYKFFVETTVTSNGYIIRVANATDVVQGTLAVTTDAAGVVIPTAATSDTITMNGSTTGGLRGSYVELQDVATGFYQVRGGLISTGTEATPFSATVS